MAETRIRLKNNKTTLDARLDRLVRFDRRSRKYPIRELVAGKKPRSYSWRCNLTLDQGEEGACCGFGTAHELIARPAEVDGISDDYARMIYHRAREIDDWPGEDYEGTSVLSAVKVVKDLGWIKSYRWAFGLEDLILGVGYNGPAVLGISWLENMMDPAYDGFIDALGREVGGHCILCRAVNVAQECFTLRNSWGAGWGMDGDCKITFSDMEKLLKRDGEACFFIARKTKGD